MTYNPPNRYLEVIVPATARHVDNGSGKCITCIQFVEGTYEGIAREADFPCEVSEILQVYDDLAADYATDALGG